VARLAGVVASAIWISGALWIFAPIAVAEFQVAQKAAVVRPTYEALERCQQKKEKEICEAEFKAEMVKLGEFFPNFEEQPIESVWVIFGRLALWVLCIPVVLLLFYSVVAWVIGGFRVARERET